MHGSVPDRATDPSCHKCAWRAVIPDHDGRLQYSDVSHPSHLPHARTAERGCVHPRSQPARHTTDDAGIMNGLVLALILAVTTLGYLIGMHVLPGPIKYAAELMSGLVLLWC